MIQCGANRNRSLNDLYVLTKSYFKSTTINEVICILLKRLKYHEDIESREFRSLFCGNIRDIVFTSDDRVYSFHIYNQKLCGLNCNILDGKRIGNSGYSFNQLKEIYDKYEQRNKV